ncbi:diaminopimelate epimerase, partial [Actinotalea sp. JY-7885]
MTHDALAAPTPAVPLAPTTLHVWKGHGTENDFVLVDDRQDALALGPELVRALTDRRAGLGGDGVIRLVASEHLPEGRDALREDPRARWFMDYRNADGSLAQMCGNGVRVLARFAEHLGLWDGAEELVLGTRAGVRRVVRVPEPAPGTGASWYAVDMGAWRLAGGPGAVASGGDAQVDVVGLPVTRPALSVDLGNPHTVLALADTAELDRADLTRAPVVAPQPPEGTNVELVVPLGEREVDGVAVGEARMRVHERGVGETRSCGTGACAAAIAVRTWAGADAPATWSV